MITQEFMFIYFKYFKVAIRKKYEKPHNSFSRL